MDHVSGTEQGLSFISRTRKRKMKFFYKTKGWKRECLLERNIISATFGTKNFWIFPMHLPQVRQLPHFP